MVKGVNKWRYVGRKRIRRMSKLDESKVRYIVREKRKGTKNAVIAEEMGVTTRWVQKLWARYKNVELNQIVYPKSMGRPKKSLIGRLEHSAVISMRILTGLGAANLKKELIEFLGIDIPRYIIHKILRDEGLVKKGSRNQKRKWIRYERKHSNSLWHTDWKLLDCGKWLICYQDDASRFVTGHGIFEHATTENALLVLETAIKNYGKPKAILTDHGTQFYANAGENKKKGTSKFETRLDDLNIKHILSRVGHPQTNGKVERLFGELQRKFPVYDAYMQRKSDPVDMFIKWYNYEHVHMSLNTDIRETPYKAFINKHRPKGIIDDESEEEQHVR